jgi:hypothetical protein
MKKIKLNEHEKFIRDLGFSEKSVLGDYLDFLKTAQEDVAINLLGHLLDQAKFIGSNLRPKTNMEGEK